MTNLTIWDCYGEAGRQGGREGGRGEGGSE